jgi:N-carbamoyl-L-amino-acid hydrolase
MAELTNLPLPGARLWDGLMEMAKIGATSKGGALADADTFREGRSPSNAGQYAA